MNVDLHGGVGPFRFGMSRAEIAAVAETAPERGRRNQFDPSDYDFFEKLRLFVYYDAQDHCGAIEVGGEVELYLEGLLVLRTPTRDMLAWARRLDPAVEVDGEGFRSRLLGLAAYAPTIQEHPERPPTSVMVFREGYLEEEDARIAALLAERRRTRNLISMSEVESLVEQISAIRGCEVLAPAGLPVLRPGDVLPDDVREFYRLCGGIRLFVGAEYPIGLVEPGGFVRSNPEIVGTECPDDITDSWYIVARGGGEEAISIDCHPDRLGRCYDSFWDRHGVAGDCAIVAMSFTELLRRLVSAKGGYWYWLTGQGAGYGDAYGAKH